VFGRRGETKPKSRFTQQPHVPKMRHEQSNDFVSFVSLCSIILAAAPPRSLTAQISLSALAYRRLDALIGMVLGGLRRVLRLAGLESVVV